MLERLERRVSRQLDKGHEAGPAWHARNGGGDRMYPVTSREKTARELKGLLWGWGFYEMSGDRVWSSVENGVKGTRKTTWG